MSQKEMYCLGVISYANLQIGQIVVISLQHGFQNKSNKFQRSSNANFSWPNWVETFLTWKAKAIYDKKRLGKKGKGMSGNFNLFNSRKPNSMKRDLSQLQGCWKRLKLQSKKDHDLQSREKWKTS